MAWNYIYTKGRLKERSRESTRGNIDMGKREVAKSVKTENWTCRKFRRLN
jgi:hypothetical protein